MKKLLYIILVAAVAPLLSSCLGDDDNNSDTYKEWREQNDQWMQLRLAEKDASGNPVYQKVTANWDTKAYVLMKWHNDRSQTIGNLQPISTSTVDVKYEVMTIDSTLIDSSKDRVTPAQGVYRTVLNKNITGWMMGIPQMHIGDSCTILIPYNQAYGNVTSNGLKPYSSLIFNVKLVGIPAYEKPVN